MAKAKTKFPKVVYIKNVVEQDGSQYFATDEDLYSLVDGDGDPTVIAKYALVESNTWRNEPQLVKSK